MGSGTWGPSVPTWMRGSGHVLELVRSQGEGASYPGVLAECARWAVGCGPR